MKKSNKKVVDVALQHPLFDSAFESIQPYLSPSKTFLLALSGGLDSSVLLHLLVKFQQIVPFELHAMHVHHGLSPNADQWATFCAQQCEALRIPCHIVQVNIDQNSQLGIEAAARQLRYQALFDFAVFDFAALDETGSHKKPDFILTAHHQDDQAETLLMQLCRGAGVKGLASMAQVDHAKRLMRPLLAIPRSALLAYAQDHAIQWCEDESNTNTDFDRNFVRHEVMPVLQTRFSALNAVFARTASHLAEAQQLLDALAELDAQLLLQDNRLCLTGLAQLALARKKNLMRWWFAQQQLSMPISMPSTEHLNTIVHQLLHAKSDALVCIPVQHLTVRRYQRYAYLMEEAPLTTYDLVWNGEPEIRLPNGDQLIFKQVLGRGLAIKLGMTKLRITNRKGGERFKPDAKRPTRTLKHLLQETNMPPWQREHLPLIYWQDTLACVPTIGVSHELQAIDDAFGIEVIWQKIHHA